MSGPTFADFMYAVVVGVAFSDIRIADPLGVLLPTFFLLFVVVEDFWVYQKEVKPRTDVFTFTSFSSLFFEFSILLAWFLAFLSRTNLITWSLVFFSAFFFMKWLASTKHLFKAAPSSRWIIHRDHVFLISVILPWLLMLFPHLPMVAIRPHDTLSSAWIVLAVVWLLQTVVWWRLVRHFKTSAARV